MSDRAGDIELPARAHVQVPPLEFPYPPCSVCGKECDHDGDGLTCPGCGLDWPDPAHSNHGRFYNVDVAPCGIRAEVILYPIARQLGGPLGDETKVAVCQRDEDHTGPHAGFDPDAAVAQYSYPEWVVWDGATNEVTW